MPGGKLPFEQLVESAPDGMIVCDPQMRIMLLNTEAERMFGYARDELIGQPIDTRIPERMRPAHAHCVAKHEGAPRSRPMGRSDERARRALVRR